MSLASVKEKGKWPRPQPGQAAVIPSAQENVMNRQIQWINDFKQALEQARQQNRAVLLDFFNPG
jgi:hypothetical protein